MKSLQEFSKQQIIASVVAAFGLFMAFILFGSVWI
jgi:hypothetical protein